MNDLKEVWYQIIRENDLEYNLRSFKREDYKPSNRVVGVLSYSRGDLEKMKSANPILYNRNLKESSIIVGAFKLNRIFQEIGPSKEEVTFFEIEDKLGVVKTLDIKNDEFENAVQIIINHLQSSSYLNTWQAKEFHDLFLKERMRCEDLEMEISKLKEELLNLYRNKSKEEAGR